MGEYHCPKRIMQRFFVSNEQIKGNIIDFDREFAHQAVKVLRLKAGDTLLCIDPQGRTHSVTLSYLGKNEASGEITDSFIEDKEANIDITLVQGIPKGDRWPYILQKCTELGVKAILPLLSERTVVKYDHDDIKKLERWQKIVKEAAEQSERQIVPKVLPPLDLNSLADFLKPFDLIILAWEEENEKSLKDIYTAHPEAKSIALIIGPEGGLSLSEANFLARAGAEIVTLGPRILRSETAAVVITALTLYHFGQMEVKR